MHGWAKCMKPEVCFVVGLVSFSGTAGVGKEKARARRTGILVFSATYP